MRQWECHTTHTRGVANNGQQNDSNKFFANVAGLRYAVDRVHKEFGGDGHHLRCTEVKQFNSMKWTHTTVTTTSSPTEVHRFSCGSSTSTSSSDSSSTFCIGCMKAVAVEGSGECVWLLSVIAGDSDRSLCPLDFSTSLSFRCFLNLVRRNFGSTYAVVATTCSPLSAYKFGWEYNWNAR